MRDGIRCCIGSGHSVAWAASIVVSRATVPLSASVVIVIVPSSPLTIIPSPRRRTPTPTPASPPRTSLARAFLRPSPHLPLLTNPSPFLLALSLCLLLSLAYGIGSWAPMIVVVVVVDVFAPICGAALALLSEVAGHWVFEVDLWHWWWGVAAF